LISVFHTSEQDFLERGAYIIQMNIETVEPSFRVIVDADACPVKREIIETARKYGVWVILIASYAHRLQAEEGVEVVQVDPSDQSADLAIANRLRARDVLVTQDFGLAAIGLAKRAIVISNRGQLYSEETIDFLLERRNEQSRIRRGGGRTKGPRAMTAEDRKVFLHVLTKVFDSLQENGPT
jgi:uncharacterized protein